MSGNLESKISFYLEINLKRILSLLNRDFNSTLVGSFDKNNWYYKKTAYPNAMMQNYVLSLAQYYKLIKDIHENTMDKENHINYDLLSNIIDEKEIEQYIINCIAYNQQIQHEDGSFDEHYLRERSNVATSFLVISTLNTYLILNSNPNNEKISLNNINYIQKALNWLISNAELHIIGNHRAAVCLAMILGYHIFQKEEYLKCFKTRIKDLLSLQNNEGWFPEYQGCDLGYSTLTFDFLTQIQNILEILIKSETKYLTDIQDIHGKLQESIADLFIFISKFVPFLPQISCYLWSRTTNHFFISGFYRYFETLCNNKDKLKEECQNCIKTYNEYWEIHQLETIDDDLFLFFSLNNFLFVINHNHFINPLKVKPKKEEEMIIKQDDLSVFFKQAGLFLIKQNNTLIQIGFRNNNFISIEPLNKLNKKINENFKNILIDTGISIHTIDNERYQSFTMKNFKSNIQSEQHYLNDGDSLDITISGTMGTIKNHSINPIQQIILNLFGITFFRIPALSKWFKKKFIEKLIINQNLHQKYEISRHILFRNNLLSIDDEITCNPSDANKIKYFYVSHGINTNYVPSKEFFMKNQYKCYEQINPSDINKSEINHNIKYQITPKFNT